MTVNESGEMYLETILRLEKEKKPIHSIEIAEALRFSKPSVSRAMKILQDAGHIFMDEHKHITLSDSGRAIAERIFEKHEILTLYLALLGVEPQTAEADACRIEHVISDQTFEKIRADYLKRAQLKRVH